MKNKGGETRLHPLRLLKWVLNELDAGRAEDYVLVSVREIENLVRRVKYGGLKNLVKKVLKKKKPR